MKLFLGLLAVLFLAVAPASARTIELQVVAMSYDQGVVQWLGASARNQRVLELGPRVFDGVARGRYSVPTRDIPLKVFFWMKPGFEQVPAVHQAVADMLMEKVSSYRYRGSRLDIVSTNYYAQWQRSFDSLPYAMDGIDAVPDMALVGTLDGAAVGWKISSDFLKYVRLIMVCPDADTVWPHRTGGHREGMIITEQEIARWLSGGFKTPTVGIVDSR